MPAHKDADKKVKVLIRQDARVYSVEAKVDALADQLANLS